ncbi:MAG: type I glutamate--ammonia ligase [Candidatus Eisenbacteria bacterium]|nr:type I glutamate--ammonia ligase [Candidatus Eisenbacteria bacterium]
MKRDDLLKRVKEDEVEIVALQFTDILGTTKSVSIPTGRLPEALDRGIWFDGSSIEGFARIYESDMVLRPDRRTYSVLPWTPSGARTARIICDIHRPDGSPFPGDPRYVLRRMMERAASMGVVYNAGPELEFFLFKKNADDKPRRMDFPLRPVPHDVGGYFDFSPLDLASAVQAEIMRYASSLGMHAESAHHEVAMAQHEIDIEYADALTSADNVITLRYTIRAVAAAHGLYATFMPKPIQGENGSGMHVHQSLFDREGKSAFFDADDRYRLSPAAYRFIAGQLAHARAFAAVVAPTVNSYKRLTPGYEAPVYVCWGRVNRSALIRVPSYSPGREQSTRAELRCPDPSANPYLAFAVMLAAGLDGIEKEMNAPEPVEEDVYDLDDAALSRSGIQSLPMTLGGALRALAGDDVIREALGEHVYDAFTRAKTAEWEEYRNYVTGWELERYLEKL